MAQIERKRKRVRAILEATAAQLQAEGVKFFVGATDNSDGKVYIQSDARGEDFFYMLSAALPTRADAVNLGVWAGKLIALRRSQEGQDSKEKTN